MTGQPNVSDRFIAELARLIEAQLAVAVSVRESSPTASDGFLAMITSPRGELRIRFERSGANSLVRAMHPDTEPSDATTVDAVRALCQQTMVALNEAPEGLRVASVRASDAPSEGTGTAHLELLWGEDGQSLRVSVSSTIDNPVPAPQPSSRSRTLDVIMDIELPLVVRFGRTELPLKTLTSLGPGSVIELGRSPEEPVDILISNRVVARGEVVIVSGNYGVRIREVVSRAERARSMEGELV